MTAEVDHSPPMTGPDHAGRSDHDHADAPATDRLTGGLGWASLALGLPAVLRPEAVVRSLGVRAGTGQRAAATAVGVRELAAGAALLRWRHPAWLWARVAGDAVDLALLGRALRGRTGRRRPGRGRTVAATASVAAVTAVDVYAAMTRAGRPTDLTLTAATTVGKSPQEVYGFWRELTNLPTFMAHLEEVRPTGERTSHWRAAGPLGTPVEWDAEIVEDTPGQVLAWRSLPGATVPNSGQVRFGAAPGDRGTEVYVRMRYALPAGRLGQAAARALGVDPRQQLDDDLRRFKQVLETGEVARSDGAPGGKRAGKEFPQRPARPLGPDETTGEPRS
jgi:uncharacterized membrane protein